MTGLRIFGIPATDAPVVAVLRRGPSDWCLVGRWDVGRMSCQTGSWLRGTIYPQRCDISPDGRWLCYFARKAGARWPAGETYIALSRLPWLTALAAWGTGGTWTRGLHFVTDRDAWPDQRPDVGDATPCRRRYGLAFTTPASFAVERRRGWTETPGTPSRGPTDRWDEWRGDAIVVQKPDPTDPSRRLTARGRYAAFRVLHPDGGTGYTLVDDTGSRELTGIQWADWAADGRLLVATEDGRLQWREHDGQTVRWEFDLTPFEPRPATPPSEAALW